MSKMRDGRDVVGYYAVHLFNRLPAAIKTYDKNVFNNRIKLFLLRSAFYSVDDFLDTEFSSANK